MNFEDIANAVGKYAPLLATALTGQAGAVAAIGSAVASTFGGVVDDPKDLLLRIASDPEAEAKLKEIEANNRPVLERIAMERAANELAADTARHKEVNTTMRAEIAKGGWAGFWRPLWGVLSAIAFVPVCWFVCWLGYQAVLKGNPDALVMIPQLTAAFATLFAIPGAILGVSAWHRGKEKRIAAGETSSPGMLSSLAQKLNPL